ncbi:MAG: hypothetical protein R2854_22280 [Caldilineaceae bacterium]
MIIPTLLRNQDVAPQEESQRRTDDAARKARNVRTAPPAQKEVSYLLSAAVVNRRFAECLMTDRAQALDIGYRADGSNLVMPTGSASWASGHRRSKSLQANYTSCFLSGPSCCGSNRQSALSTRAEHPVAKCRVLGVVAWQCRLNDQRSQDGIR